MFRHPDLNKQSKEIKNFGSEELFDQSINQSIRFYRVPSVKEKSDVLNLLLDEITQLKIIRPEKNRARRLYIAIGSVASAACLLLFLWYFAFSFQTYEGVQGENNTFILPDQSKVILSSNSQIKFSKLFFIRKVALQGEGYFEVEKGDGFSVKTQNGEVKVLGTKFSVSDNEDGFVVYCFDGMVGVKYGKEERQLLKGEHFIRPERIETAEDIIIEELIAETIEEVEIINPLLFDKTFYNKNVKDIWPIIEKHFGVTIYSNIPDDRRFTGSIKSENINDVVNIICTSLDMSFVKVGSNEILIQNGNI
jgi:transmembrane sensor